MSSMKGIWEYLMQRDDIMASMADSANFMYKDATPLVNPVSAPELEPPFRIVRSAAAIIFQGLSLVAVAGLSFVLPAVSSESNRSPTDAYSVILYAHTCLWASMTLIDSYLRHQHNILHCSGYIYYYQLTRRLRRANVYIVSAGSTMLLLLSVLVDNYCHDRGSCPGSPLKPVHYIQILLTLETVLALPFLLKYLVMTLNFHKNKYKPDSLHDELLLSFMHSQSSAGDLGFRDDNYFEDVLEKQSDMIRYLKKYNAFLGRKILNLSVELNNFRAHTSC
ncbi:transmembrane protein 192 isoform X2 [Dermacentor andersoni]|uniref:transmembrane protein 192 isoform X2 n=1 Tax=Dermacentor andersoni TaxID=34620 RepID=UPI002155375E|nr:transmembrane protein 192-like isoform X2 [Dermacentor andersoni]